MKFTVKLAIAGILASAAMGSSAPQAFAWGCYAQANDGAYGYTENYPNKQTARRQAKAQCQVRTNNPCHVTSCDPNG